MDKKILFFLILLITMIPFTSARYVVYITKVSNATVNSSNYWDGLDTPSDIPESVYWINWNASGFIKDWSGAGGNTSWNQSLADTLYCTIDEPLWSANYTAFNSSWSSTYNSSYVPQEAWNSTYNATYASSSIPINLSNVTINSNLTMGNYNISANWFIGNGSLLTSIFWAGLSAPMEAWNSTYNASYVPQEAWNSTYNATYDAYNSTGLIQDWNASGFIIGWNSSGLVIDWNVTGFIINWSKVIFGGDNTSWNESYANTLYCTIDEPLWTGNSTLVAYQSDLAYYINNTLLANNLANYMNMTNFSTQLNNITIVRATNTSFLDVYVTNRITGYINNTQLANNLVNYINGTLLANNLVSYMNMSNFSTQLNNVTIVRATNISFLSAYVTNRITGYINNTQLANNLVNYVNTTKFNTIGNWTAGLSNLSMSNCSGTDKMIGIYLHNASIVCATDQTGGGSYVQTTTCQGTDKVSAIDNVTGIVTCTADETGGAGNPFDQVLNTTSNVTFNNITATGNISASWFKGAFNWIISTASSFWLSFTGTELSFNETNLNITINKSIDARVIYQDAWNWTSNATYDAWAKGSYNKSLNITSSNFTVDTNINIKGYSIFNATQLNVTNINASTIRATEINTSRLNITNSGNITLGNATIYWNGTALIIKVS